MKLKFNSLAAIAKYVFGVVVAAFDLKYKQKKLFKMSLFPAKFSSSSWGIVRCSQAKLDILSLGRFLCLQQLDIGLSRY